MLRTEIMDVLASADHAAERAFRDCDGCELNEWDLPMLCSEHDHHGDGLTAQGPFVNALLSVVLHPSAGTFPMVLASRVAAHAEALVGLGGIAAFVHSLGSLSEAIDRASRPVVGEEITGPPVGAVRTPASDEGQAGAENFPSTAPASPDTRRVTLVPSHAFCGSCHVNMSSEAMPLEERRVWAIDVPFDMDDDVRVRCAACAGIPTD